MTDQDVAVSIIVRANRVTGASPFNQSYLSFDWKNNFVIEINDELLKVNVLLVFHWKSIQSFLVFFVICLSLSYDGESK